MKGQLATMALGVIVALILLFVGIFAISTVADLQAEKDNYDYTYTTLSNTTTGIINSTQNQTRSFDLGSFASIKDETPDKEVSVKVENTGTVDTNITVSLESNSLGTFTASASANTTHTYTDVSLTESAQNNVTVESDATGTTNNLKSVSVKYPSDKHTTNMGGIYTNLVTNTGTMYDVLILTIILVALGVAIAVLRGFSGGAPVPRGTPV